MKRELLIGLILLVTGFAACKKAEVGGGSSGSGVGNGPGNGIAPGGCIPAPCQGALCTAVFTEIHVDVRDQNGAAVNLDAFVVTDAAGVALPPSNGSSVYGYPNNGDGRYTIVNDAWVQGHQNSTMAVRARGYINGIEVFNEPYTIEADCCHVSRPSGKDLITVIIRQ